MGVPRHRAIFLALPALLAFPVAAWADLKENYRFPDGGQERTFEIAHDEVRFASRTRALRRAPVTGATTAEATRQAAVKIASITGEQAELVLYERGVPRNDFTRRILTAHLAVRLGPKADPAALARAHRLLNGGPLSPGSAWYIFHTLETGGALEAAEKLAAESGVEQAIPQLARLRQKRFTPNDPLFADQWHLKNTGQSGSVAGTDVNVTTVWDNWKGAGLRIGIVDDGLQVSHPDLAMNVDAANDHDWNDATPDDPSPNTSTNENVGDYHGTACAGVAAGRGNNGLGVSGAAPEATLVGLRLIAAAETDQDDHDALAWKNDLIQVKSNSWGPADDGRTLEAPGPLLAQAFEDAVTTGRGGLGTIITWAGGNGGSAGDNSNYDGYANSIYTIAIAAIGNNGVQSSYSEPGANLVVAAPSDGSTLGITTVDLVGATGYHQVSTANGGDYANDFGGTSSSAPLAAGCIALLLQSKPSLGWRDVQEILIKSATKCDAADTDWITNAAGLHFNHRYGAGLLNAQAAVNLAATWTNLPPQQNAVFAQTGLSVAIPDNNAGGITRTFAVNQSLRVEQVAVKVNITHARRGQLEVTLTSPAGTISRLAETHLTSTSLADYANWTFTTRRDWGENSAGNWTLKVADRTASTTGTLSEATLTVFGTFTNQPPAISAATITPAGPAYVGDTLQVSGVTASDAEGDAITLAYQWQASADGANFTALAGATAASLGAAAAQSGQMVRCRITPTSAGAEGAAFFTAAVALNRRPPQLAQTGQPYSYDSDLFLAVAPNSGRALIINEFSQATGSNSEWVELLILRTADLRGFTLADATDTYTTFADVSSWAATPAGTRIVIYRGNVAKDTRLPADDLDPAGGNMIIPHNHASYFAAGIWSGLSNTGDSILVKDAAGAVVDGISYGNGSGQTPGLPLVGSSSAAALQTDTEASAEVAANWSVIASNTATPGTGNSTANTQFILSPTAPAFRFGAAGNAVPGLSIDPVSGVVSGTPQVPGGGFFNVVIERFAGAQMVAQSFPLAVTDAAGSVTLPAGQTWVLNTDYMLAGGLRVAGTLDTGGHSLTVGGALATAGGSVLNASGLLSYRHRSGPLPPGALALIADPANDLADDDADGGKNAVEFMLGTDPSAASASPVATAVVGGRLEITFSVPVGILGVTPVVEVSGDLVTWNSGAGFTQTLSDTTAGGFRTLTVRDLATAAPRYLRLRAAR